MCGILGITGRHQDEATRALETLAHRGPDARCVVSDKNITLGHARLSIIDLDVRANQPFFSEDGNVGIVFNGEIYNYLLLKEELVREGYTFKTTSDTEVLVVAYQAWGSAFVSRLRGMFAFALYDVQERTVRLSVDHVGIKPLYYWHQGTDLVFGSELKAIVSLLKSKSIPGKISKKALTLYQALGYVPAPHTLYEGVHKMVPCSTIVFNLETGEQTQEYYDTPLSTVETPEELLACIESSVEEHLIADVPVGLFFSGGTDSSLIASILHTKGISLKAFCVELPERPQDAKYAASIAERLGISLTTLPFTTAVFEEIIEDVLSKIDDPIADSSLFPTYYVSKVAKKEVTVVLSGEGGDEYFFGYPRSRDLYRLKNASVDSSVSFLEWLYFSLPAIRGKNKLFERLFVWSGKPLAFYLLTMSPTKSHMGLTAWRETKRELAHTVQEASFFDAKLYLPNVLLRKTDMATMYASLEGRVPLLDTRVVEAAKSMKQSSPEEVLKPVLKEILSSFLPKEDVYRKKTGFGLRTPHMFYASNVLQEEYKKASMYLVSHGLFTGRMPDTESMLKSNPNMCWQIIMLYRACKNLEYGV